MFGIKNTKFIFFKLPRKSKILLYDYFDNKYQKIFFDKGREEELKNDCIGVDESLGGHLPVTEKELFELRVKEIKKRRRREEMEGENKKEPINVKEELVLLSVFLFVIYLFWNNGI